METERIKILNKALDAYHKKKYTAALAALQPLLKANDPGAISFANDIAVLLGGSGPGNRAGAPADALGTARWADSHVISDRFAFDTSLFGSNDSGLTEGRSNGQIWLGETVDTGEAVGYRDDRHVCLVSGTRGGKGTGVIIPNLCLWPGSCIVIDPKGENATITALRRGEGSEYSLPLGQAMWVLDPFNEVEIASSLKARFNPLTAIDPSSDFAVDDAGRIASAIVVAETVSDPFWTDAARSLIKTLILHVLTDPDFAGRRNLISVWKLINQGDWINIGLLKRNGVKPEGSPFDFLWQGMIRNEAFNGLISGVGQQMVDMAEKTRSGVLKTAINQLEFMDGPAMQRIMEESDFELSDLKQSLCGLTLYLTLPQRYMKTHYRWLRLMVNLGLGEMEHRKGRPATGFPTLFVLDEFAGLKRMEEIEHAAAQAAGFGVKFFFVVQNLGQLKDVYRDSWETFLGNSGVKIFFHIEDEFTSSYVSRQLGERELVRNMRTQSQSHTYTETEAHSNTESVTRGRSQTASESVGRQQSNSQTLGQSHTSGMNTSSGYSTSHGASSGHSSGPNGGSFQWGRNRSASKSFSEGVSRSQSLSQSVSASQSTNQSFSTSHSTSEAETLARSISHSRSNGTTNGTGLNETLHKRSLLNPDEIGRQFARVDDRNHPNYPGLMLVLIPGQDTIQLRRVNYFESDRFEGFFDPHPEHAPPLSIDELIERNMEKLLESEEADAENKEVEDALKSRAVRFLLFTVVTFVCGSMIALFTHYTDIGSTIAVLSIISGFSVAAMVGLFLSDENPQTKMNWLVVLAAVGGVPVVLMFLFGVIGLFSASGRPAGIMFIAYSACTLGMFMWVGMPLDGSHYPVDEFRKGPSWPWLRRLMNL